MRNALLRLLREAGGTPSEQITRALGVLVEQLAMEVAYVSRFEGSRRLISHSVSTAADLPSLLGRADPVKETMCYRAATGALEPLLSDVRSHPLLGSDPRVLELGIGAHAAVPLKVADQLVGALCCAARSPVTLTERDADLLHAIGSYVIDLLSGTIQPPSAADPAQLDLGQVATVLAGQDDLEGLARPMLELLHQITGLESTYLTLINWTADQQRVVYSVNHGELAVLEDLTVAWEDSLCKRSLDEDRRFTEDVPGCWSDSDAARELGIQTYASVPILDRDHEVVGTLCGASSRPVPFDRRHLAAMELFARLLSSQLAREVARSEDIARTAALEQRMGELRTLAERDPLTGLTNRTGIVNWLDAALRQLRPDRDRLVVAFVDLDDFKLVNDTYGHAVGDEVLHRFADSLSAVGRPGDLHGRLGGDEFVVAALVPATDAAFGGWQARLRRAVTVEVGDLRITGTLGVASVDDPRLRPDQVLRQADEVMYRNKRSRPATELADA